MKKKDIVYQRQHGGPYWIRKQVNGRLIFQSLRTHNKEVARERARGLIRKAEEKQFEAIRSTQTRGGYPTCEEIAVLWKELAECRGLAKRTISTSLSSFRKVARTHGKVEEVRLNQLTRSTVIKYVRRHRPEQSDPEALVRWKRTMKSTFRQARQIFARWAMDEFEERGLHLPDLTEFKQAEVVNSKGVAKTYVQPLESEVRPIFEGAVMLEQEQSPLYLVFLLVYPLALRAGEAENARLEWLQQAGDGSWTLRVPVDQRFTPKGGRDRLLPVHASVARGLLESAARGEDYFLPGGATARRNLIERDFSEWMKGLGWKRMKKAHELRALQGCRWYTEQGAEVAQLLLGHKSIQTTCTFYAHYTETPEALEPNWC